MKHQRFIPLVALLLACQTTLGQSSKAQLLSKTENAYNPVPSPDGTKIAYVRTGWGRNYPIVSMGRSNLITEVKVMDSEGRILTEKPLADTFLAGWTPDGKNLICYRDYKYFLVSLDGIKSKETQIPYDQWSRHDKAERGALIYSRLTQLYSSRAGGPNIIFIMTDDHAAHAIGAYGSRVNKTPNLDRLAREGALLTNVFATNSICTPSRAAILTGQYSHINGVTMFNRFDSSRMTVARLLQQGGYYTGMIGKWHLGSDPAGFDHWEILPGQGVYKNPLLYTATGEKTYAARYVTDVITDLALDFLENRPRGKPFFLMMHHKAPHRPWEPSEAHAAHFASERVPEPVTFWDAYQTRTDALHENKQRVAADLTNRDLKLKPPAGLTGEDLTRWLSAKPESVTLIRDGKAVTLTGDALTRWKYQRYMQDYLATVQSVDESVGQMLRYLDKTGLARNTVVVYTSDQGFFLGDHGLYDKRFMYEESIRMPMLVRWPAGIKPGSRSDAMALNIDIAPTFLEIAGLPMSAQMQGRSVLPVLRGSRPRDWRTSMYYRYYHDPGDHNTRAHFGVRTRTHKLIYFWKKDQWELFDLVNDPHELHNLYGEPGQEAVTAALKAELARLKREVRDEDQLADEQLPNGVDGPAARLRGK